MALIATVTAMLTATPATEAPIARAPATTPHCQPCQYSPRSRRRAEHRLKLALWYLRRHHATRPYRGWLASTRACESGGNYDTLSTGGLYRGAYQFDYQTWRSVGGHGDPATAPPLEQDYRATLLLRHRGTAPWPMCG